MRGAGDRVRLSIGSGLGSAQRPVLSNASVAYPPAVGTDALAILLGAVCLVLGVGLTTNRWGLASRWTEYTAQVLARERRQPWVQPGKLFRATPFTVGLPLAAFGIVMLLAGVLGA